jgi:Holliday junction resolvase RusA-like endonuclease
MIFIPGNVPSSKNHRIWTGKTLISNKATRDYKDHTEVHWTRNKAEWFKKIEGLQPPYKISLFFNRNTTQRFDYINIAQVIFDLMTKWGWIDDDSANFVIPVFKGFTKDATNPGVFIDIVRSEI